MPPLNTVRAGGLSSYCGALASDGAQPMHNIPEDAKSPRAGTVEAENCVKFGLLLAVQDAQSSRHPVMDKHPILWQALGVFNVFMEDHDGACGSYRRASGEAPASRA